jgi:hypothetical protein
MGGEEEEKKEKQSSPVFMMLFHATKFWKRDCFFKSWLYKVHTFQRCI